MSDDQIKDILKNSKTIAMIGVNSLKKKEDPKMIKRKPSTIVMKYMRTDDENKGLRKPKLLTLMSYYGLV